MAWEPATELVVHRGDGAIARAPSSVARASGERRSELSPGGDIARAHFALRSGAQIYSYLQRRIVMQIPSPVFRSWCGRALLLVALSICASLAPADVAAEPPETSTPEVVTASAFLDTYYAYEFGNPADNLRPGFLFNHNRHNEFTINMALLGLGYEGSVVRAKLSLMAGTYAQYNYAAELPMLRSIFEARAGIRLAENLWWDAGVFPSHLGWESAISIVNPTLTRSLASANSPFYLAGTKLYWQPSEQWTLGLVLANGWQNIQETPGNGSKGGGTQVTWSPSEVLSLNSSTWISNEFPGTDPRLRLFHDFYAAIRPLGSLSFLLGFDIGAQQTADDVDRPWDVWWTTALITRLELSESLASALRLEYYSDPNEVIIEIDGDPSLRTVAASLNFDVRPAGPLLLRLEGRALRATEEVFTLGGEPSRFNVAVTASMAIAFDAKMAIAP
jgi:hypothetical protein